MQINLKQPEIEQALRAYVVAQGISLHGKDLTISFTAGRRESGISAEISIEDVEIPGYTNAVSESNVFVPTVVVPLVAVTTAAVAEEVLQQVEQETVAVVAEEVPQPEVEVAVVGEAKATVSLFG